jgi:hypothetical protein
MFNLLRCLLLAARSLSNTQRELALENLALRHQGNRGFLVLLSED